MGNYPDWKDCNDQLSMYVCNFINERQKLQFKNDSESFYQKTAMANKTI